MLSLRHVIPLATTLSLASACTERHQRPAADPLNMPAQDGGSQNGQQEWVLINAPDNPFPCLNPRPSHLQQLWHGLALYECDNGLLIRPREKACGPSSASGEDECQQDSDCSEGDACHCGGAPHDPAYNFCMGKGYNDCRSDQDCSPGFHCGTATWGIYEDAIYYLRCQSTLDQCAGSEDCYGAEDAGDSYIDPTACQADDASRFCCSRSAGGCDE
jgi:hypothetical protein